MRAVQVRDVLSDAVPLSVCGLAAFCLEQHILIDSDARLHLKFESSVEETIRNIACEIFQSACPAKAHCLW